jgi:predicted 2-oxoglutarate/Fe(II)-dependent dioxygenase YbiX
VTAFALPPVAQPGDRLPDTWLRFDDGERVRLHKAFGGRALWFAADVPVATLEVSPDGVDALYIGELQGALPARWRAVAVDPTWAALLAPGVVELDANFRVVGVAGATAHAAVEALDAAATRACAPVLQVPRVLEPDLCRALIAHFEQDCGGGEASRVLVLEDGRQVSALDPSIKARRESPIRSAELEAAVQARLLRRVVPEIARVFQFEVTRRDPFKLLAYADDAGYFRPHRDNDTPDVAHRRFAISLNLDAGAYEGGAFRFPEFGPHPYAPATGDALAFSCSLLHEVLPVTRGVRHALTTFVM